MKILFVAGRELSYSRTHVVLKALRSQGFEVVECFPPDRSFRHYPKLIWRAVRLAADCQLIIVGFYGQIILPFIKLLTGKPILFDMYIATYDTMVYDRGKAKPRSLKAGLYGLSDKIAAWLSKHIVLESDSHIDYFSQKFHISRAKFTRIFLAVDENYIFPRTRQKETEKFLVHFHGEYAPFHGIQYILKAAHLLQGQPIEFQIIGRGITYDEDHRLAKELQLTNVRFLDPVPYEQLADCIARADVCLGIFGHNERTLVVTTNKVIESIAMRKPLITGRNQPVQELLTHGESVYLVERANPQALAQAILLLKGKDDLRRKLAEQGHKVFLQHCTLEALGKGFASIIFEMEANEN
jgi:glycosyltransferase involved in cell wall biosynthesis